MVGGGNTNDDFSILLLEIVPLWRAVGFVHCSPKSVNNLTAFLQIWLQRLNFCTKQTFLPCMNTFIKKHTRYFKDSSQVWLNADVRIYKQEIVFSAGLGQIRQGCRRQTSEREKNVHVSFRSFPFSLNRSNTIFRSFPFSLNRSNTAGCDNVSEEIG
jgi:hypothetical protein